MFPRDYFLKINRTFYFFKLHLSLISDWHIQDSLILSAEVSSDSSCYSNQHHRAVPGNRGCVSPHAGEEGPFGRLCRRWDLSLWSADRGGVEAHISSLIAETSEKPGGSGKRWEAALASLIFLLCQNHWGGRGGQRGRHLALLPWAAQCPLLGPGLTFLFLSSSSPFFSSWPLPPTTFELMI